MKPGSASELLQELIRIPSVNPSGNPGTAGVGEERCAQAIAGFLETQGVVTELRYVLPGRPNVIGRFSTDRPGKPRLLLAPHTDTVSVAGMTIDPFGGELREGRIWGRGASDTKGSIAAMLWALLLERDQLATASYEVWFAGLAGEEAGQQGAHALSTEEPFDFVIAGEPTSMDVVHTHKGCTRLHLTSRGRAVHAAQPERGENAIAKMLPALQLFLGEVTARQAAVVDPVLGPGTLNVGTIQGGSKINIVPDHCELGVDLRTVPGQSQPEIEGYLRERLAEVAPGCELEVEHATPLHTDPAHPLIQLLQRGGSRPVGAPWYCDAAIFARNGTPAIALGPGSIAQAHTVDEWLTVADLDHGVERLRAFLRAL